MSITQFEHDSRPAVRELVKAFGVSAERREDSAPDGTRAMRWLIRGNDAWRGDEFVGDYLHRMNVRYAAGFGERHDWRDGGRRVWQSDGLMIVATYCEGDVTFDIADNRTAYEALIAWIDKFYKG